MAIRAPLLVASAGKTQHRLAARRDPAGRSQSHPGASAPAGHSGRWPAAWSRRSDPGGRGRDRRRPRHGRSGLAAPGARWSPRLPSHRPDPDHDGASTLSAQQADAAETLAAGVRAGSFAVTLLDGVTGSGKTETYLEAVAEAIRRGRQSLILLPEIALSAQWLERFARRFGVQPAVWHSELTPATRRRTWRAVAGGRSTCRRRCSLSSVPALSRSRPHRGR